MRPACRLALCWLPFVSDCDQVARCAVAALFAAKNVVTVCAWAWFVHLALNTQHCSHPARASARLRRILLRLHELLHRECVPLRCPCWSSCAALVCDVCKHAESRPCDLPGPRYALDVARSEECYLQGVDQTLQKKRKRPHNAPRLLAPPGNPDNCLPSIGGKVLGDTSGCAEGSGPPWCIVKSAVHRDDASQRAHNSALRPTLPLQTPAAASPYLPTHAAPDPSHPDHWRDGRR